MSSRAVAVALLICALSVGSSDANGVRVFGRSLGAIKAGFSCKTEAECVPGLKCLNIHEGKRGESRYAQLFDFISGRAQKERVKREDERAEIRWKLWLREKAMLVGEPDGG